MIKKVYRIPEAAQNFMEAPLLIRRGEDVIIRYDYEQSDGSYGYRGVLFANCSQYYFTPEQSVKFADYREAYNSIAVGDESYYIFFDGYGLYTFWASDYELLDNIDLNQNDNVII